MATIITKNSSTAGAVPIAGDLVQGEIAVNVTDKKLYTKNASGSVVQITPTVNDNGFKNRIINGAMMIDQRNAGALITNPTNQQFLVDRWQYEATQTSKVNIRQNYNSVTPPVGFTNYLGVVSNSAYSLGAGDIFDVRQSIEGFNVADLAWGTANAKTVTLSFQVYSSLTGTFGGALKNSNQDRSYPFTYTINAANTWTTISVTIAGDTSGTWLTDNGVGVRVVFGLGVGSTYSGTAGAWAGTSYYSAIGATSVVGTSGATFYITGVQLEKGSTATSFDYRPYGTELALCQRYAYATNGSNGLSGSGDTVSVQQRFSLPTMRATPTLTTITAGSAIISDDYSANYTASNAGFSLQQANTNFARVVITGFSGLTSGRFAAGLGTGTGVILFSAEL